MQQFTLPLLNKSSYHIDDFIVSSSNRDAYNFINNWSKNWGVLPIPYCVLLQGSKSSGKTHLARIWRSLSDAYILSHNQLLSVATLESFNAFIIEDCEYWAEHDLLHSINILHEAKKYLLLTTSKINSNGLLADLDSRIKAMLKIAISQPDDQLMQILIFKYFSNCSVKLSNQALQFLLHRLPRQFDQMICAMEKINNFALTRHRNITVALMQEVIQ